MRYQIYRNRALAAYNNCCAWCGSQYDLCLDHVQTQATGGADTFDNLQVLCRRCNSIKNMWTMPKLPPRDPQTDDGKIWKILVAVYMAYSITAAIILLMGIVWLILGA